jgi:hypothetical protein
MRTTFWAFSLAVLSLSVNANAAPIALSTQLGTDAVVIDFEAYSNGQALPNGLTIGNAVFSSVTGNLSIFELLSLGHRRSGRFRERAVARGRA